MYREEEERSLNEDFILPMIEDDLDINDIPSIEEMFSIDKEEVEQIQKISSVSSDNAEDTSEALNLNTQSENSVSDTEENIVPEFGTDISNENFDNSSDSINLLNTDDMLVADEDTLNTAESAGDLIAASVMPKIEEVGEERLNSLDFGENLRNDNEFSPEFAEKNIDIDINDYNSNTIENDESVRQSKQPDDVFAQIDALLDDNGAFDITSTQSPTVNTTDLDDTAVSIPQQEYEAGINSEFSFTDGEFENKETFDFSYEETESSVEDNKSVETALPKYKSAFNPIKYMRETSSENKEFNDNKEIFDFSPTSEDIPIPENNFSEQPFIEPAVSNEETSSENENANYKDVVEFLYVEDGTTDSAENLVSSENEEEDDDDDDVAELNLDEPSGKDNTLTNGKAKKIILSAVVGVVLIGACITAVSVFNRKSAEEIAELNKNDISTPLEAVPSSDTISPIIEKNTNVNSAVPDINAIEHSKTDAVKQDAVTDEIKKRLTPINSESYLSISKIQWQIPHYLSYSPNMNSYLQKAGKSIKLQLSNDLLLVNEYAYSNVVKVNLKLNNSGVLQNTNILTSSGSKQIDDIVLQSVKSTLNVIRLPENEVKTSDLNLTITIYF